MCGYIALKGPHDRRKFSEKFILSFISFWILSRTFNNKLLYLEDLVYCFLNKIASFAGFSDFTIMSGLFIVSVLSFVLINGSGDNRDSLWFLEIYK